MPIFFSGVAVVVLILLAMSLRILREYERGVVFQLGRFWAVKGPGLIVLMGLFVMGIVFAMLLPIFQMSNLIH